MARRRVAALAVGLTCTFGLLLFGSNGASSACAASAYGDGADGPFTGGNPNTIRTPLSSTAAAGQTAIAVADSSGFTVGSEVFIQQVTGAGHGSFEFGCVAAQGVGSITLTAPLTRTYSQDTVSRTQVLRVPHLTTVSGFITTAEWNGNVGGIVVFRALAVDGANIDVSSKGHKGGYGQDSAVHAGYGNEPAPVCTWTSGQGQAQQGHSYTGVAGCTKAPNGDRMVAGAGAVAKGPSSRAASSARGAAAGMARPAATVAAAPRVLAELSTVRST